MSNHRITFRLAAYTDPAGKWSEGAPNKGNEDNLFVDADLENDIQGQFVADEVQPLGKAGCLMVVADGMGGMNAGEVASAIAIETVKNAFSKEHLTPAVLASAESRARFMEKIVVDADAAIKEKSNADKQCEGMGSTLILAWLCEDMLTVTWCGDSRAYLFRESEGIRQISKDHSYVQGLVDEGKITAEEAFTHPYGNIVTRSLGDPNAKARPDSVTVSVCKGDIILLCSDGLSGVLRDRKSYDQDGALIPGMNLEDIIRGHRGSLTECRSALWEAAEQSDWYDNVTAILCEIMDGPEQAAVAKTADPEPARRSPWKTLGALAGILALLCCLFFLWKQFMDPGKKELERFVQVRDSLVTVSDSIGIVAVSQRLASLPDSVDFAALDDCRKDLELRQYLLARLDTLQLEVARAKIPGLKRRADELIQAVKESETVEPAQVDELSNSLDRWNEINAEIDEWLPIPGLRRILMDVLSGLSEQPNIDEKDQQQVESFLPKRARPKV